jgi:hypothetical protein
MLYLCVLLKIRRRLTYSSSARSFVNHKFPNAPLPPHALAASADVIPERIGNGDDDIVLGLHPR